MKAYYNENDKFAAQWLRNLISEGLIAPGDVDERSIVDVRAKDLAGYTQCHLFAGIGGWSHALRLAGWKDNWPVWTGSCPCQPFSCAGRGRGENDERHLWPEFRRLVEECQPSTIFGEQVASKAGRDWFSGVRVDLETLGYETGCADLCAASTGAPHIRQRLFWVGNTDVKRCDRKQISIFSRRQDKEGIETAWASGVGWLVNTSYKRPQGQCGDGNGSCQSGRDYTQEDGSVTATGFWSDFDVVWCRDKKFRRVESGTFPLAYGIPRSLGKGKPELRQLAKDARANRKGQLKGYGNAIVPQVAATFIEAYMGAMEQEGGNI